MKLTISATTARANFAPILLQGPLDESFKIAEDIGYDAIELHLRDPHEIDWDKTAQLSASCSLPVAAIGTGAGARVDGLTFTDPDKDVRDRSIERIREHLKLAKRLNAGIIIGSMNGNIQGDNKRKKYHLDCLKQCCEIASKDGVMILLEPLNRYESDWFNTAADTIAIIEKVGYPHLKYLADTFHMNIEEADICQSLKAAGKHLGHVHLVDSNRCVPGYGHIPFDKVIRALRDIKYNGKLSFECLAKPSAEKAATDALNHLRRLLSEN